MTELSFLVDLLLNHKLPKATQTAIAERIKVVEREMTRPAPVLAPTFQTRAVVAPAPIPPHMVGQSASTIAAMMRQEQVAPPRPDEQALIAAQQHGLTPQPPAPQPVAVIAQTPAAAAAIAERNTAIAAQISGKPEKGRTSPRKF